MTTNEHQRLKDQVVDAALNSLCEIDGDIGLSSTGAYLIVRAATDLRDHLSRSSTPEAPTCEPPVEHRDWAWHWINIRSHENGEIKFSPACYMWFDRRWLIPGYNKAITGAELSQNGHVYLCPARPPSTDTPSEITDEEIDAILQDSVERINGIPYMAMGRQWIVYECHLREFARTLLSKASPSLSDETLLALRVIALTRDPDVYLTDARKVVGR